MIMIVTVGLVKIAITILQTTYCEIIIKTIKNLDFIIILAMIIIVMIMITIAVVVFSPIVDQVDTIFLRSAQV